MKALLNLTDKEEIFQKAYLYSMLLVAATLFFPKILVTNLSIMLLCLVWLLEGNFKEKYRRVKSNPVAVSYIIFFILYFIGAFYTEDLINGIKSLETKASLLVFPVIFVSAGIKRDSLHKVLISFAYICAACSLIALLYQTNVVLEKNDFNYFFSDGLVSIMDKKAVYYAIYVAFSILILTDHLWSCLHKFSAKKKAFIVVTIVFLLLIHFLLATRASLVVLLLMLTFTLIVAGIRYGKLKYTALLVAGLFAFILVLSLLFPQTISRFKSLRNVSYDFSNTEEIYHFSGADSEAKWNGLNMRLAKWECALDVIKEHPVAGVGTGDVKDEMVVAYLRRNFIYAAEGRFDPHNQYFDTAVAIGLPGLIILLLCYFLPLYLAYKRKSWLMGTFIILFIVCSLTESVLSSAQGIIFFCFSIFILLQLTSDLEYTNRPTDNVVARTAR